MFTVERNQLKKILVEELKQDEATAQVNSEVFPVLDDQLEESMKQWLTDRTVVDVSVEGVSLKEIMEKHGSNFLYAISSLNDLLNPKMDPVQKEALKKFLASPLIRR